MGWNPWRYWNVMNDWNVWNIWNAFGRSCGWNAWNVSGRSCSRHGWISSRRSPCLLCVEFLSGLKLSLPSGCSSSSNRRALCLLHVELNSGWMFVVCGYPCRIGAKESCRTSSCRMQFLEVSVKTVMPLLRMKHF